MPATEQTWRDTKLLHKIFAVSGVIMLGATIWMFVADHSRPWKPYQRKGVDIENELTSWRAAQLTSEQADRERQDLQAAVDAARREPIPQDLVARFVAQVSGDPATQSQSRKAEKLAQTAAEMPSVEGTEAAEPIREEVLAGMREIVADVKATEDRLLIYLKFARADRDADVAKVGLLLRDEREKDMESQQAKVEGVKADVESKQLAYDAVRAQREALQEIVHQITAAEDAAQEALDKKKGELTQLEEANQARRSTFVVWWNEAIPLPGKKWLELPILDAFNSPRKIENLWSEGLQIDYNFSKVRRFDRCTTCHQSVLKTVPGSAIEPAYESEYTVEFLLEPPAAAEAATANSGSSQQPAADLTPEKLLQARYGLQLADEGLLDINDVTVKYVQPASLAARAVSVGEAAGTQTGADIRRNLLRTAGAPEVVAPGLNVGDVIVAIDGDPVRDARKVLFRLLDSAEAGQSLHLTVRRGLPHPYASHPRLDLFVGSLSPHKLEDFACTICHDGQGSATSFEWASHYPNTDLQRKDWQRRYGWFDNPHWIYPMYPDRFIEATCLKCHHEVADLEPSEQYPDAPAPRVVHGFNLIRKFGCFGCHEMNGYDRGKRIGPDLRLEPNYFAAALQLQAESGFEKFNDEVRQWAAELAEHPERNDVRHRLYEALLADGSAESPALSKYVHATLVPIFKDVENAGVLRKPGPSLRFSGSKLDAEFLFDWIRNPKNFRPTTRMPQFFGLWSHLEGHGHGDVVEQFEPLEVLGIATYLQQRSQPFAYMPPLEGVVEASADRGKLAFQTRGCLACHTHKDFPDTAAYRGENEIVQGPDLSGVGAKFDPARNPDGAKWLYSWIRQPSRYHARTAMPDLFLTPIAQSDGSWTDPVADIVAYLTADGGAWRPAEGTLRGPADIDQTVLDRLVIENLKDAFAEARAKQFAVEGIPANLRDELKGAEVELLNDAEGVLVNGQVSVDAKLLYLGRRSIAKYGCYGCHDIPTFEDAKPIGTALSDWGRKDPSRLAFEHIGEYLKGHASATEHVEESTEHATTAVDGETPEMHEFYHRQIEGGHRAGFIYQKLLEPRSYDYHKTDNKKYNERLRMPQFPFTAQEREAVITFVLGLVAAPPSDKYIYKPDPRAAAIMAGRQVLDKYNCAGCHMLEPERWDVLLTAGQLGQQPAVKAYPFLQTHLTPETLTNSAKLDRSGFAQAHLHGMPALDDFGIPMAYDSFGDPLVDDESYSAADLELPFDLWRPTALEGQPFEVGVLPLNIKASQLHRRQPSRGGFLAKYLLPYAVQLEKAVNPAAKGTEAWGWLPPPLFNEGSKVQTSWLHDFLLNPYAIRPAVMLRMPKFNMSPDEATKLVNYFAAVDNVAYPYNTSERQQLTYLGAKEREYQEVLQARGVSGSTRLDDALKIVTNNNYCVKCHLVGDFEPKGSDRAKAPNLAKVYERLRPDFLRKWIANPKTILPYTSMPVNVPYDPDLPNLGGVSQDLYHGTSIEQVDALVDLLLNYDEFAKQRSLIAPLVSEAPPADGTTPGVVPSPVSGNTAGVVNRPVPEPRPAPEAKPAPMPPPAQPKPGAAAVSPSDKPLPDSLKNLPQATGWGDLKVRFVYDGDAPAPRAIVPNKDAEYCGKFEIVDESLVVNSANGGLQNVVGWLQKDRGVNAIPIHESYLAHARDKVVLDNKGCRFEPHVGLLWTTQALVLKNSDTVGHNTNYMTLSNVGQNVIIPARGQIEQSLGAVERIPAKVACNIHPWMNAKLVVKDHPYMAVSDKDGILEMKNLPAGEWTIQFYHEQLVAKVTVNGQAEDWSRGEKKVMITDGESTDLGEVKYKP